MLSFSTVTFLPCEIIGSYLIKSLHLYFLVYGFQNNLAPASASVLTTSGANVNANLGGKKNFFLSSFCPHFKIVSFLHIHLCVCIYRIWCSEERDQRWQRHQHRSLYK